MNQMTIDTQQRLIEMALTTEDGLAKMEKLIEMQNAEEARKEKKIYMTAMAEMQGVMPVIKKKKINNHNKSKFASLDDIVLTIQPILTKFGFSYRWEQQFSTTDNPNIRVTCVVTHASGHSESSMVQGLPDNAGAQGNANKNPVQGNISTVTYLRRASLTGVFGLVCADEDIDGRIEGVTQRQQTAANGVTQSATMNNLLTLGAPDYESLMGDLCAAQTIAELNTVGANIQKFKGDDRAELEQIYHQQREAIKNGKRDQ